MPTKKVFIKGMHCPSCEKIINDEFKTINGVERVRIDRKANTAEINYHGDSLSLDDLRRSISKYDYDVSDSEFSKDKTSWTQWLLAVVIVFIFFLAYKFFQWTGLLDAFGFSNSEVSVGAAFLIGIVASLSSCLAVVGSVIIAFSEKYKASGSGFYEKSLKPNLLFQAGRLGTFFVLGGILGLIGGKLNISGNLISVFTIIIALVMAWLGLNILGILPSISRLGIKMPGAFSKRWDNLKESEHKAAPLLLGGLTFFLPCGFTQSMQIFALASGSFFSGALALFFFALGTSPVLLTLGAATSWTSGRKTQVFKKVAGFLVLIFAFYTFNSGWALLGVKANVISTDNSDNNSVSLLNSNDSGNNGGQDDQQNEQVVNMSVQSYGYDPAVLTIKKGVPVKWVISGDYVTGCTSRIIVPSLNISQGLQSGQNIIRFTPTESGEIPFSCGMGMVRGKFIVE